MLLRAATRPGDLVMDFFGGSGTVAAAAEKLGRRWIACDIGKLAYFTMQKRVLQLSESKNLYNNRKYGKNARSFITCSLGSYDLKAALEMEYSRYKDFVSGLFNIDLKEFNLGGCAFNGKKDGDPVIIFNYGLLKDSNVDEAFISDMGKRLCGRLSGGRVYIVAPSTRVDFITDYETLDGVRYYFLKIPYQVVRELHSKDFKKFRQPRSRSGVNSLDESLGFSFNRTPSVKSGVSEKDGKILVTIKEFTSGEPRSAKTDEEKKLSGFELLSAVFADRSYNGREFILTDAFFADELTNTGDALSFELDKPAGGGAVMLVYTDIFGNDLTESFTL